MIANFFVATPAGDLVRQQPAVFALDDAVALADPRLQAHAFVMTTACSPGGPPTDRILQGRWCRATP